jgi:hypothetical protein
MLMYGEVAERLKAHAWKACLGKPNVGSNPTLSASFCSEFFMLYDEALMGPGPAQPRPVNPVRSGRKQR